MSAGKTNAGGSSLDSACPAGRGISLRALIASHLTSSLWEASGGTLDLGIYSELPRFVPSISPRKGCRGPPSYTTCATCARPSSSPFSTCLPSWYKTGGIPCWALQFRVSHSAGRKDARYPDCPGSKHCSVVSELFLRLHHWGLGRFTRTPGPLQGYFLLHLTIPLLRVTKSGWLRAEVPWGECGHTSPVVSQHS